jgi:sorbitol-6-phosphate 2-dehydrogenase
MEDMMDLISAAPFLRGLALKDAAAGGAYAYVSAATPAADIPAKAITIRLGADGGEAAMQGSLRAAYEKSGPGSDKLFALDAPDATLLLATGSSLEEAWSLLPGSDAHAEAYAAAAKPGGAQAGDPAARAPRLVTAPPGAAEPAPASGLRARALGAAGRDRVVEGKIALVTGGAQGFGEEIVRGLHASGAVVFIADLNLAGAERLAAELNAAAGRTGAIALAMDVGSEQSVAAAFGQIARIAGGLDLVVSNAGVLKAGAVLEQSLADFEFVTKVNYTAFFLIAKYAGLMMKRQHQGAPGHAADLIQINSKSGLTGSNKNGAYAGSKFGGIGLVQSFALELVEHGVKVNAICPGNFFDGPLWSDPDRGLFVQYLRTGKVPGAKTVADVKAFYEAKVPMGRGCEGPDVMRAIYYLVEQRYETGQALPVTGGQVMLN